MTKLKKKFIVEIYAADSKSGWVLLDPAFESEEDAVSNISVTYPDRTFKVTPVFKHQTVS